MKKHKIYHFILVLLIIFIGAGCEDFLKEESVSKIAAESYVVNEAGYEDLVKSCYPLLREFILQYNLVNKGTDIIGSEWNEKVVGDNAPFDQYNVNFNSSTGDLQTFWDLLYREIGRTNSAIERAADITFANPARKEVRVAEAKFLRALSYFYLVQTWGDVPMPLTETVAPTKAITRVPSAEVYMQILKDLTEA